MFRFVYRIFKISLQFNIIKKGSLQAQAHNVFCGRPGGTSCIASSESDLDKERGSVVVEAALSLPVFLCALAAFMTIGQMLIINAQIQSSLLQAARYQAQKCAEKSLSGGGEEESAGQVFDRYLDSSSLLLACVEGGKGGIRISQSREEGEFIRVSARYRMKVLLPFFSGIRIRSKGSGRSRIFSGYVEHGPGRDKEDKIVYVTEYGSVYHTRADCSHICLTIKDGSRIRAIVNAGHYQACSKCVRRGETLTAIYVTAQGDCYHGSLSCSGLKRKVRAIPLSEAGGMRCCGRCGN